MHRLMKTIGGVFTTATLVATAVITVNTPLKQDISTADTTSADVFQAAAENDMPYIWYDFNNDDRYIPYEQTYLNGYMEYSTCPVENVFEPDKTKIATDWVEPEPVPITQPTPQFQPDPEPVKYVTYQLPQYTPEEIAANILSPYKAPVNVDTGNFKITYYPENMVDAMATPHLEALCNDSDLYEMARIINAECGGMGDEAMRCVGTVLVNRVWSAEHPNTLTGVIYEKNQFSTAYTTKEPTEAAYAAAYDIIYNDYRSFPHYVDSFQSIKENYW